MNGATDQLQISYKYAINPIKANKSLEPRVSSNMKCWDNVEN
jgi:hypothetical protein